jgi:GDP-4-dehydro-6-deoxy-D-mannose reductase
MRILVTGAMGFVGRCATARLREQGHEVVGMDLSSSIPAGMQGVLGADLRNAQELEALVRQVHPEACLHLGGIAFVPMGWTDPDLVFSVNLTGTIHLLEAFRHHAPQARVLIVTSAEVYGKAGGADIHVKEEDSLHPENLYAVSKASADLTALLYARRYDMPIMTARPINHIGPGQSHSFVVSAFASQLADISLKRGDPVMQVGNLNAQRDFTDVRDVCRAYQLLLEKGRAGEAYNIATGTPVSIGNMLDMLCEVAGVKPKLEISPVLYRPTDFRPILSTEKIRQDVGWTPEIPLSTTLRDVYYDIHRSRLSQVAHAEP